MTQSAVSKLCAELEDEVGVPLFERTTRRVVPCDGASDLYDHAQQVLGTLRSAERSLAGLRGLEHGRLSFSSSPMMMHALLQPAIAHFHLEHPGISLDLYELTTEESVEFVRSGRGDFSLVAFSGDDPQLDARMVLREPMRLAVPPGHVLASRHNVLWPELALHEHITLRSVYSVRRTIDRILNAHGVGLPSTIQAGTLSSALGLVRAGLGVTLVPSYAASFAVNLGLNVVNVGGDLEEHHEISLLTRRDSRPSLAAAAFIAQLDELLDGRPRSPRSSND